ncbi:MAG TPA: ABC transporter permease [Woeseiaceae bacterium]|nr:ABC transporter permease [Woeseiaceae bacterium]
MISDWLHDLRYAGRALARSPGFTAVAVLTVAIGIGANTAIFSVVNAVLLKPLELPEPDRLVRVYDGSAGTLGTASPPNFVDWRRDNTVFEDMAAYASTGAALTGVGAAKRVAGAAVTAGFFPVLGTAPMLGRAISSADTVAGQERVVVLSHGLWQRHFGADPGITGRTVQLEGRDYTVIGVMPPGFEYPAGAELWAPLGFSEEELATQRGAHYLDVIARLKPGVTVGEASAQMTALARVLELRHPDTNTGASAAAVGLREAIVGDVRPALLILLGAVGFVLLIACANVANLLLARTAGRKRELAVRCALGAGRGRLVRYVLTESVVLATAGGVAGLLLAGLGLKLLLMLPVEAVPRLEGTELDGKVLGFTIAVSMLTGVLFGLLPALRAGSSSDLTGALKSGSAAITADRAGGRTRGALVVAEMALAVLLLTGAGLLLKSFVELQRVDPGFNPSGVLTFDLALPTARYPEPGQARAFFAELDRSIEALPGVESAAGVFGLPLSGFNYTISVEKQDGGPAYENPGEERYTQVRIITPDYFRTMEIALLAGRTLTESDRAGTQPVVVVNESAAKLLWPGDDPVGHTFELGTTLGLEGPHVGGTVVGVVADVKHQGLGEESQPEVFAAHSQFPVDFMSITVRTAVPPESLIGPIREQLRAIDSELPMDQVRTMEQRVAESVAQPRFYMLLLSVFAGAALFLAAIGIYGVIAYAVRNRINEIGVRRALGACAGDVLRMVIGRAMALALGGLAVGLLAAFALTRVLSGLLYDVSATDPATFIAVAVLLPAVALLASYLPARRAARIDPMTALREE